MAVWAIFLCCYLAFIVLFMVIPASLGLSFGIRNLYLATLYKVFEVSACVFIYRDKTIVQRPTCTVILVYNKFVNRAYKDLFLLSLVSFIAAILTLFRIMTVFFNHLRG